MKKVVILILASLIIILTIFLVFSKRLPVTNSSKEETQARLKIDHPLAIATMRKETYPGSELVLEQELGLASNYQEYIASYQSEGLKIYGLLTVPTGEKPAQGWPVIIFNHGYIPPESYQTTERYVTYVDSLASNGFIVFKPDFRGHGQSEGQPEGTYYSPAYATDALNALATLKRYSEANPQKIGMWGHSMGSNIILRDIVVNTQDIKAAVIWSGVVGNYDDLINQWHKKASYQPSERELALRNNNRKRITDLYGTPASNPDFWQQVDPTYFLSDITTPVQLHAGTADEEVPFSFSTSLKDKLAALGKVVEYYEYPEADHNLSSPAFELAMERTVKFFDQYLKAGS